MIKKIVVYLLGAAICISLFWSTSYLFASSTSLKESDDTTYVEITSSDLYTRQSFLVENMSVQEQVGQSDVLFVGKVVDILPTVETNDLIDSGILEAREKGYKYVHTDVIIEVLEYIGEKKLDFNEVVVRRQGGRIGNSVHSTDMENLSVGEEIILTRLEKPENVTQVPNGFEPDQYFLFSPNSKFVSKGKGRFYLENDPNEVITKEDIIDITNKLNTSQ